MWKHYLNALENLDALLLALVLNVNVLRIFMGIQDTNLLLYMLYVFSILVLAWKSGNRIIVMLGKNSTLRRVLYYIIYLLLYSFVSLTWVSYANAPISLLKFTVVLILSYLCIYIEKSRIKLVIFYFICINILYSIMFILSPGRVYSLMGDGMNYLNTTLTLGCSFSISLVSMVFAYFDRKLLIVALYGVLSVLFFIALIGFAARAVLLFPPIILLSLMLFMGRRHMWKSFVAIAFVVILMIYAIDYFINNASDYTISRMTHLVEDSEDEDRWELWYKCISIMIDRMWFVFGGGIEAFHSRIYYPHNIFLQILGEFGIIPFAIFFSMILSVFKYFYVLNKSKEILNKNTLFSVMAAFVYYLMTFSKSFSMYDALPLFIMMALLFAYYNGYFRLFKIRY